METLKSLKDIPTIKTKARPRSMDESNPFMMTHLAHGAMDSPMINLVMIDGERHPVPNIMINDEAACRDILLDKEGIWRKGPQTYEPFLSLVPKHLIGLDGEYHAFLRGKAQDALAEALGEGRVPGSKIGAKLVQAITRAIETNHASWMGTVKEFEGQKCLVVPQLDRVFRSAALELITETIFGKSWHVIDDYTEANVKAITLQRLMYELHWRVTDLTQRTWRRNHREEPVGSLQDILDTYILDEIDLSLARKNGPVTCMLDSWTRDEELTREEIRNLCMTFLTMGSENVSTGLAWLGVFLSEKDEELQHRVRNSKEDLVQAFHDAMRLSPSVAVLTRTNIKDTEICGYFIPRFTEVTINMYSLHRNEETWGENAGEFCPFAREVSVSTEGPPHAFPFGGGKRSCIGRPLTMHELHSIFAQVVQNFRLIAVHDKEGGGKSGEVERNENASTQPNNFISLRPGLHKIALVPLIKAKI